MPPLARVTSSGQRHDSLAFLPLMDRLSIARRGRGRPRTRPGRVLGDKAGLSSRVRSACRPRGAVRPRRAHTATPLAPSGWSRTGAFPGPAALIAAPDRSRKVGGGLPGFAGQSGRRESACPDQAVRISPRPGRGRTSSGCTQAFHLCQPTRVPECSAPNVWPGRTKNSTCPVP